MGGGVRGAGVGAWMHACLMHIFMNSTVLQAYVMPWLLMAISCIDYPPFCKIVWCVCMCVCCTGSAARRHRASSYSAASTRQ